VKALANVVVSGLIGLVVFGALLFVPAWTFHYWQGWVVLILVSVLSTWIPSVYLMLKNPAALERRMRGGPVAETRTPQKLAMAGLWLTLGAMFVFSVLDHRFWWSYVPTPVCVAGDVLVAIGLSMASLVIMHNSYAAATVGVQADQTVVSTGFYGLVRHPMYTGIVITLVGLPLALGSYWGLIFVIPGVLLLAFRIRDEEGMLQKELDGYRAYSQQVRYRLVPGMW
jgi:protein-S-isoprenylcysteine O-methyltransferase Ste14